MIFELPKTVRILLSLISDKAAAAEGTFEESAGGGDSVGAGGSLAGVGVGGSGLVECTVWPTK